MVPRAGNSSETGQAVSFTRSGGEEGLLEPWKIIEDVTGDIQGPREDVRIEARLRLPNTDIPALAAGADSEPLPKLENLGKQTAVAMCLGPQCLDKAEVGETVNKQLLNQ